MLIDMHTHIQPSTEAAASFLRFLGRETEDGRGTLAHARAEMVEARVDRVMVVPWMPAQDIIGRRTTKGMDRAAVTEQVLAEWHDYNGWAVDAVTADPEQVSCLVGIEPVLMSPDLVRREVRLRLEQGAVGIKISPMFLGVSLDDPVLQVVWEAATEHGVFVLVEAETAGFRGQPVWGHPSGLWQVLERFPTMTVQIAHLSRGGETEVAALAATHPHVYADLAQRLTNIGTGGWTAERLAGMIRSIGIERVLYGTNYPLTDMKASAEAFDALPLSPDEKALVARGNAEKLLSLR